jgi:hypothetical protein
MRRHARLPFEARMQVSWKDSRGQVQSQRAKCLDLSAEGAAWRRTHPSRRAPVITLHSTRYGSLGTASVRHCVRHTLKYSIGVEFTSSLALAGHGPQALPGGNSTPAESRHDRTGSPARFESARLLAGAAGDLADLDISPTLVQDLFMRTVREQGQSSLGSLRERLKLPPAVLEPIPPTAPAGLSGREGHSGQRLPFWTHGRGQDAGRRARLRSVPTPAPRRCRSRHTIAPCGCRRRTCMSAAIAYARPSATWSSRKACWTNSVPR